MELKCKDCGTVLNEGEAKTFTCCDECWGKHYEKTYKRNPDIINTVDAWHEILRTEGHWFAINQSLIDLYLHKCTAGNVLDFLQEIIPNEKIMDEMNDEINAGNLVISQAKSLIDGLEKENTKYSERIGEFKERYETVANALVLAVNILNRKDGHVTIEENEKITYARSLLNPKD